MHLPLISEPSLCRFFEACVSESDNGSESAKVDFERWSKTCKRTEVLRVDELGISAEQLAGIIVLRVSNNSIGSSAAS